MLPKAILSAVSLLACANAAAAFVPRKFDSKMQMKILRNPAGFQKRSVVSMASAVDRAAIGSLALGVILTSTSIVTPLIAIPEPAVAARSGGRAGGSRSFRSAPPPRASTRMAAPAAAGARGTTVINNNYRSGYGGGVMMMPPVFSPFGYSPFGGIGTGYALGTLSAGGNRQESYRIENELGRTESEVSNVEEQLQAEKEKNDLLEKRLSAIEASIAPATK